MIKYIGKKEVQAERMNEYEAVQLGYARPNEDNHEWQEGYHVVYEDGYHSWCPKNVFEKANRASETFLDRLHIEAEELAEKQDKLNRFIGSEKFKELSWEHQRLLEAQFGAMLSYLTILQLRIKRAESNSASKELYRASDVSVSKCGDNRFEVIAKAKESILKQTNIESSLSEMEVLDNILFRCWQMGWLEGVKL